VPSGWISNFTRPARISGAFNLEPALSRRDRLWIAEPVNSKILRLSLHINLRVAMLCREVMKLIQEEAVCH